MGVGVSLLCSLLVLFSFLSNLCRRQRPQTPRGRTSVHWALAVARYHLNITLFNGQNDPWRNRSLDQCRR